MSDDGSRAQFRQKIVADQDEIAALCYIGDGLHRLAKAVELMLDPEAVASHRYRNVRSLSAVDEEEAA